MPRGVYNRKANIQYGGFRKGHKDLVPIESRKRQGLKMKGDNNPAKRSGIGKKISLVKKGIPHFNQRGEKHGNWKGGITPINNKIRGSLEYKLWQDSVLNKNCNCCQKCGEDRINKLVAHHILNFSEYPELRFAIDNGITLCRKCHNWFHRKYSKKNNNKNQINEFLISYNKR